MWNPAQYFFAAHDRSYKGVVLLMQERSSAAIYRT